MEKKNQLAHMNLYIIKEVNSAHGQYNMTNKPYVYIIYNVVFCYHKLQNNYQVTEFRSNGRSGLLELTMREMKKKN